MGHLVALPIILIDRSRGSVSLVLSSILFLICFLKWLYHKGPRKSFTCFFDQHFCTLYSDWWRIKVFQKVRCNIIYSSNLWISVTKCFSIKLCYWPKIWCWEANPSSNLTLLWWKFYKQHYPVQKMQCQQNNGRTHTGQWFHPNLWHSHGLFHWFLTYWMGTKQ